MTAPEVAAGDVRSGDHLAVPPDRQRLRELVAVDRRRSGGDLPDGRERPAGLSHCGALRVLPFVWQRWQNQTAHRRARPSG